MDTEYYILAKFSHIWAKYRSEFEADVWIYLLFHM